MTRIVQLPVTLADFSADLLVRCPRCGGCAHLLCVQTASDEGYRLACTHCGLARDWLLRRDGGFPVPSGGPALPAFGTALWLVTPCCGRELWAFNGDHLAFLEAHVGAKLRGVRPDPRWGWSNRGLQSRLPRWMTSAGNREAVLRAVARLRARLEGC
jgi:hypothetical protein